jgi:hypothetical protein
LFLFDFINRCPMRASAPILFAQKMSYADGRNTFLMSKTVPPKTNNILLYRSAKQFLALDSALGFAHSLRASHQTF